MSDEGYDSECRENEGLRARIAELEAENERLRDAAQYALVELDLTPGSFETVERACHVLKDALDAPNPPPDKTAGTGPRTDLDVTKGGE